MTLPYPAPGMRGVGDRLPYLQNISACNCGPAGVDGSCVKVRIPCFLDGAIKAQTEPASIAPPA